MKKTVRILAFAITLIMLALTLASCGAPNSDPDKAKKALEKNGYTAVKTNGYFSGIAAAFLGKENTVDASVTGTKTETDKDGNKKTESVFILYFKTADAAKDAWDDIKSENEKKDDSDWVVARSGKIIYYGTKAAIKAAR